MTRLERLGEFGLIELLTRDMPADGSVSTGIGDDCAVVRVGKQTLLFSCDAFIENIHFRRKWASPEDIGYKAAAAALSDIGAMGGAPRYMLVTLACDRHTDTDYLEQLYKGIKAITNAERVSVIGGDTTGSPGGIMISITVIGKAMGAPICRSGAQPGDLVVVTGHPGCAVLGLHALEHGDAEAPENLINAHLRPRPKLREGMFLGDNNCVNAMIDISDGLVQDLGHIARQSEVSINIETNKIPLLPEQRNYARERGLSVLDAALSGGEDYELAFTLSRAHARILTEFTMQFVLPLTIIGSVSKGPALVTVDGAAYSHTGYDHFHVAK